MYGSKMFKKVLTSSKSRFRIASLMSWTKRPPFLRSTREYILVVVGSKSACFLAPAVTSLSVFPIFNSGLKLINSKR